MIAKHQQRRWLGLPIPPDDGEPPDHVNQLARCVTFRHKTFDLARKIRGVAGLEKEFAQVCEFWAEAQQLIRAGLESWQPTAAQQERPH